MSTTEYDAEKNTLYIKKSPISSQGTGSTEPLQEQPTSLEAGLSPASLGSPEVTPVGETTMVAPQKMKAFMLTVTNDPGDIEKMQKGLPLEQSNKVNLFPVLAPSEEAAVKSAQQQGFAILGLSHYEFLLFQVELIEKVAKDANVELIKENLFKVESLNKV